MSGQHETFNDGDLQVVKAKLSHIETGLIRLETAMVQVIDLTKHVALLQERADNHKADTQAMDGRYSSALRDLTDSLKHAVEERERSIKKVHERLDGLQRWVYMVMGGGLVVASLLVYAAESGKTLLTEVVRLHDSELLIKTRMDRLEKDGKPQN